tara:strand:+ start:573 stop:917 length:345 start_codon:yes stop_codon:yes gene_type:complete
VNNKNKLGQVYTSGMPDHPKAFLSNDKLVMLGILLHWGKNSKCSIQIILKLMRTFMTVDETKKARLYFDGVFISRKRRAATIKTIKDMTTDDIDAVKLLLSVGRSHGEGKTTKK